MIIIYYDYNILWLCITQTAKVWWHLSARGKFGATSTLYKGSWRCSLHDQVALCRFMETTLTKCISKLPSLNRPGPGAESWLTHRRSERLLRTEKCGCVSCVEYFQKERVFIVLVLLEAYWLLFLCTTIINVQRCCQHGHHHGAILSGQIQRTQLWTFRIWQWLGMAWTTLICCRLARKQKWCPKTETAGSWPSAL